MVHTRITPIPDEDVVLESFQALKEYVGSAFRDTISSCQLLYEPSVLKRPYCYLFLSRGSHMRPGDVWAKMKGDTAAPTMEYPFSVIINSDDNYRNGENPEFESFDGHEEEDLNWATVPGDVDVTSDDFFDELVIDLEGAFVMFGHSYDYASRRWDNRVAIWVCFEDPIRKYFPSSRLSKSTAKSYKGIPVLFLSASKSIPLSSSVGIDDIIVTPASDDYGCEFWSDRGVVPDGKIASGMGFQINLDERMCWRKRTYGTLGPRVETVIIPDAAAAAAADSNAYFVSKHVVQHSCDGIIYDVARNPIGRIQSVHEFLDVAVVELLCDHTAEVKISEANERITIDDFIPFSNRPGKESLRRGGDLPSFDVFKSGHSSGITKGSIYSWGIRVGVNGNLGDEDLNSKLNKKWEGNKGKGNGCHRDYYILAKGTNGGIFCKAGDSGGPVVAIQRGSRNPKFIGMVELGIAIPNNMKYPICAILPILHSFLDSRNYTGE